MSKYEIITKNGYAGEEVISSLQKCIRRGNEQDALFWAVELYESGYAEWCWKRLRIISSNISSEIWALYSMAKESSKNKEDKAEPQRLFLTHAIIKLCRAKKSRLIDWVLIWAWIRHPFLKTAIPDVALDKHTTRGRMMKRSWKHFFDEGSFLVNHEPQHFEERYREWAKDAISNPSGESLFN
ncbi:MAG: hypothetical protein ACK41O_05625 [Runella zeae]